MEREYERFFRCGGYRLMRLLVIKTEVEPVCREGMDVFSLMRLRNGDDEGTMRKRLAERTRFAEIFELDRALEVLLAELPRNWGQVIDEHFGKGVRTKASGTGIRKRTVENALKGVCRKISQSTEFDFAGAGLLSVRKIMGCMEQATAIGENPDTSPIMRAVTGMKLFRRHQNGIIYSDALEEFCAKAGVRTQACCGESGREALASDLFIRQEIDDGLQRAGLERKVHEGRSSILIDRMYEMCCIMAAIQEYMPQKYDRIMAFHRTQSKEKLTEMFTETAALLLFAEDAEHKVMLLDDEITINYINGKKRS